jgi:cysteine-S-conjugate beta-lyase
MESYSIQVSSIAGFEAMLAFEIRESLGTAHAFMKRLKLIKNGLSLRGIESTICDPATTSHQKVSAEVRKRLGVTDALMRFSVGIEDPEDLIEDLATALRSR